MDTEKLVKRLEEHPELKRQIEALLTIADDPDDIITLGDDAEEMIIQTGRKLDKAALQVWAEQKAKKQSAQFGRRHKGANKDGKKNSPGTHV